MAHAHFSPYSSEMVRDPRPIPRVLRPPKPDPRLQAAQELANSPWFRGPPAREGLPAFGGLELQKKRPQKEEPSPLPPLITPNKREETLSLMREKPFATRRAQPGKNWIRDLVGKRLDEAVKIIQGNHLPYRVVQIDGIMMNYGGAGRGRQEISLSLVTSEGFTPTGTTSDAKQRDQLRVSAWFSRQPEKAVVLTAELSH